MKITEIFSALFPKIRKVQGPRNSNFPKVESKILKQPDEIKFAGDAKLYASLRTELSKMDGTRAEKVAELQRRLDDGTYNVVTEELANKILGE